jgi:hypothetical protein
MKIGLIKDSKLVYDKSITNFLLFYICPKHKILVRVPMSLRGAQRRSNPIISKNKIFQRLLRRCAPRNDNIWEIAIPDEKFMLGSAFPILEINIAFCYTIPEIFHQQY